MLTRKTKYSFFHLFNIFGNRKLENKEKKVIEPHKANNITYLVNNILYEFFIIIDLSGIIDNDI